VIKGLNSRLDELQAALLQVKLSQLEEYVDRRIEIAHAYLEQLQDVRQITLPKIREDSRHSFHLFVIQAENRDSLREFLKSKGIETQIHYPTPIHFQECYREYSSVSLPDTEKCSRHILSLPIHPFLTNEEVHTISSMIISFYHT
jgi:dTDP-4-amino-4,6-dideoxygalactose transaminase